MVVDEGTVRVVLVDTPLVVVVVRGPDEVVVVVLDGDETSVVVLLVVVGDDSAPTVVNDPEGAEGDGGSPRAQRLVSGTQTGSGLQQVPTWHTKPVGQLPRGLPSGPSLHGIKPSQATGTPQKL